MSITEKALDASLPSIEFERQALVITVPSQYEEIVLLQRSLSDLSKTAIAFIENKNSFHGSNASLKDEIEI